MERQPKPLHYGQDVATHVRALQEQGDFRGGVNSPENQGPTPGEGEVPEGHIFYPGEVSPRSPPDCPAQDQGEPQAGKQEEADKLDFDFPVEEFPRAIFRCPDLHNLRSKPNEKPERP